MSADAFARLAAALADRYRFEEGAHGGAHLLGQGGMATVYLAEDLKHQRKVAIKVLRPELAASLGPERFLREISITARFDHPNILPLLDSGEAAGVLYYIMPFVEGESLRDRLTRQKQLPLDEALRIAREVADALGYAHAREVIHRDIKPENILLSAGHARVADFGIARAITEAGGDRLTETGLAIGTPTYMSPEQSLGERDLDGRSDLYALGCVLYEMLAGEPPYTGSTAQAVVAKRMTQAVPSVRVLRETVPAAVDRAITIVLAKSPADRFPSATDLVAALSVVHDPHATTRVPAAHPPARRWIPAVVGLLLLAAVALGLLRSRRGVAPVLDPNLIAIAPIDVPDPSLAVWREGVVDLLSRTLDGAGSLRTVSPSVVLRRWQGRSDRASAISLGRRTGAGFASTGSLSRNGPDSVELRAAVLDVRRSSVVGEVTVVGTTDRLGALVDSLGLEMLRTLSRDRPVAAARQATIGSAPLPALKAFLRGEQFYRRSSYDSALVAYDQALRSDSAFTLAYYRMGQVLSWNPPTGPAYGEFEEFIEQAGKRNHGLGARDSLLIEATRLMLSEGRAQDSTLWYEHRQLATGLEAVRRYPGDPEVWYQLGEIRTHGRPGVIDPLEALAAFDRSIALDSGYGPAYAHTLQLSILTGQAARALQYARAGIRLTPSNETVSTVGLESRLLLSPGMGTPELTRELESATTIVVYVAGIDFLEWPDSGETAVRIFQWLASRHLKARESAEHVVDSLMRYRYVAAALALRGHLHEAMKVDAALLANPGASQFSEFLDPFVALAMLGVLPDSVAARGFSPAGLAAVPVNGEFDAYQRRLQGFPWLAMKSDTMALRVFALRLEKISSTSHNETRDKARYLAGTASAFLALAQGDSAGALRQFAALPDSACALVACFYAKLAQGQLLAAHQSDSSAAVVFDQYVLRSYSVLAVPARLERARVAERLHDPATAARLYRFVLDAWRHADPELQPYVAEAQAGLIRSAGAPQ